MISVHRYHVTFGYKSWRFMWWKVDPKFLPMGDQYKYCMAIFTPWTRWVWTFRGENY